MIRRVFLFMSIVTALGASPACNGAPPFPPDLVTIRGQVTAHGSGLANAPVWGIDRAARDASTDAGLVGPILTDASGHFTFYGFGTTYDIVVAPTATSHDYTVVEALTRRDPVITLASPLAPTHEGHVATTWTTAPPDGATVAYFFSPPTYPGVKLVDVAPVSAAFSDGLSVHWTGGFSTTGVVQTLVYFTDASGAPSSYVGSASGYGWFSEGGTMQLTFSLQTIDTSPGTLNLQAPDGYSVESADVGLDFGAGGTPVYLMHYAAPASSITFDLPDVPANRLNARGVATRGGETATAYTLGNATSGQSTTLDIAFLAASSLTSPDDGATSVDASTSFRFDGTGVNEVLFAPADGSATTVRVLTADASVELDPIASATGITLTRGASYSWSTRRFPDYASTDAFDGAETDLSTARISTSATRKFTTASP